MLRGQDSLVESTSMSVIMVFALVIIAVLKTATFIIALSVDKNKNVLPVYADEAHTTAIRRSPSDSTIHKRLMNVREPPIPSSIRSPPQTPSSLVRPLSFEVHEVQLQMPSLVEKS